MFVNSNKIKYESLCKRILFVPDTKQNVTAIATYRFVSRAVFGLEPNFEKNFRPKIKSLLTNTK